MQRFYCRARGFGKLGLERAAPVSLLRLGNESVSLRGTVGEDLDGIAASSGSENNGLGSGEARDVRICTQEDRCHTAGEVGEAEEGGVDSYDKPIIETVMARRYSLTLS